MKKRRFVKDSERYSKAVALQVTRTIEQIDEQILQWQRVNEMEKRRDHILSLPKPQPSSSSLPEQVEMESDDDDDLDDALALSDWRAKRV